MVSKASSNFRKLIGVVLAVAGLIDSLYLGWLKVTGNTAACSGVGDCDAVNSSRFATIGDIPIAFIGALGYVVIILCFILESHRPERDETITFAMFGVTFVGTLYSAYLTYVEVAVIRAICPFCVLSAIFMTALFVLSISRLRETLVIEQREAD